MLVTGGNHEIGSSEAWLHYMHRWPTPYREARSTSPLYWSADVGPVHVVALNSYDNFVNGGDRLQRSWLEQDLSSVDRAATPWLIVMMARPPRPPSFAPRVTPSTRFRPRSTPRSTTRTALTRSKPS